MAHNKIRIILPPIPNSILKTGILIMIVKTVAGYSRFIHISDEIDNFISILFTLLFVTSILRDNYNLWTLFLYALCTIISLVICYNVGNYSILITILTILALRKRDISEAIYFIFSWELVIVIFHSIVALILSTSGLDLFREVRGVSRFTLGFTHPNTLSLLFFNFCSMWVWLHFERITLKHMLTIIFIAVVLYAATKTRTALIEFFILLLLLSISRFKIGCKFINIFANFIFPMLSFVFYLMIRYYTTNKAIVAIDNIISGRIKLSAYAYSLNGVTFFGRNYFDFNVIYDSYWQMTNNTFTFDSLYGCYLLNYGIILIIVISICFYFLASKKDVKVNIFILLWSLYGITEGHGFYCYSFFPLLLITILFLQDQESALKL